MSTTVGARASGGGETEGEHGAADLAQGGGKTVHERPQDQGVAELEGDQPGEQLDQQYDGPLAGQYLVLALVVPQGLGDQAVKGVHPGVDDVGEHGRARPRHHQRPHNVGGDRQHYERTDDEPQYVQEGHRPGPPALMEPASRHMTMLPLTQATVPPPTQIAPASSWSMCTRPARPRAVPWLTT